MSSETVVQQRVRLACATIGPFFRNNSGACYDDRGRLIRYGLGNDSKAVNDAIKSSDIIGITPVTAYLASVSSWVTLGVFTALEVKQSDWRFNQSDNRAVAQAKFHDIVRSSGGYAGFVTDEKDIQTIIRRF